MPKLWEKIIPLETFQKKNMLPESPGVYFFLDEKKELLYIGKATSLRDRVKSYFSRDILESRGPKIGLMLGRVKFAAYKKTDSVLEALILEAILIKEHQPDYNTDAKDDKSYNHVVVTKEKFPRVLTVRERDITQNTFTTPIKYSYGPFPSGGGLRDAMKIVRRLFPFRDKCLPADVGRGQGIPADNQQLTTSNKKLKTKAKPCFSAQIGLCPGVCDGSISAREYGKIINHIRLFFEGHKSTVVKQLEREMKVAAKNLEFERAGEIKKTIFGLKHIQDMALVKDDIREIQKHRIEAYDVAHLGGTGSVGVMVVVQNSKIASSEYRQFRLRGIHKGNDLTALEEVLLRRLKHTEWPLPEMIVVDGNKVQVEQAQQVLDTFSVTIPIIGVAKNEKHKPDHFVGPEALVKRFKKEILLANHEAHRFAIAFHRKRRNKEFIS